MILHFVNDEKIINRTVEMFEEQFPGENIFVVANRLHHPFKCVNGAPCIYSRGEFLRGIEDFSTPDRIYIHLLNKRKISLLRSLNLKRLKADGVKIYWIIWGLDLYNNLLEPAGFKIYDINSLSIAGLHPSVGNFFAFVGRLNRKFSANIIVRFVQKYVDYIVTDTTENDYDYLVKYYPSLACKPRKDFFYYPLDVVLGEDLHKSLLKFDNEVIDNGGVCGGACGGNGSVCNGDSSAGNGSICNGGGNIIIGNSGSASNNHLYAMSKIAALNLGTRKIYVPLSYSCIKRYVRCVLYGGRKLFGNRFCPLLDFMPLREYNKLQMSISVALYGNWRQEAVGNILVFLFMGTKVFLSKRNPVYEWALSHGLKVFELEGITQEQLDTPLTASEKISNREIVKNSFTKERLLKLIRDL
ncbi:MAG: TDP-N-acetylfucosamine:lipid II N-acetylfucosaminyltransferase [Bacteroidales bacterium]|nr:TDP-N-acetylfucosamine:lipid II N-acetylfucosaminyltransferase [Bacteroidales bacterium]